MNVQRMMSLTLSAVFGVGLSAQGDVPTLRVALEQPRLTALDALLGAKLVPAAVDASGVQRGEQGKVDKDGAGKEKDSSAASSGVVTDLVIDLTTRRITFAAVQVDSGARALPISALQFDAARKVWQWSGGATAMLRAPEFRAQRLDALHSNIVEASGEKQVDADKGRSDSGKATGKEAAIAHADSGRYVLASECAKREVHASDGRCATTKNLVFELGTASLAFLCASADGGDLAIPAGALLTQQPTSPAATPTFSVALGKDAVRRVPHLGKDLQQLDDRAWRAKLYDAFLVPSPAFEKLTVRKD